MGLYSYCIRKLMNKKIVMLVFDISSQKTGFACFVNAKYDNGKTIDLSKIKDKDIRLKHMQMEIIRVCKECNPEIIVVENPIYKSNIKSYGILKEILGTIEGYCIANNIYYHKYYPSEWRKQLKEFGPIPKKRDELKAWSIESVKKKYLFMPDDDNHSDAILIGDAYINEMADIERKA